MNLRNNYPIQIDYETEEEYEAAVDAFWDAIEADFEEGRM